jgi:hypothetical protein
VDGIEQIGDDGLDLVVAAVERLPATPPAATGKAPVFGGRHEIRSIGDELAVDGEDCR